MFSAIALSMIASSLCGNSAVAVALGIGDRGLVNIAAESVRPEGAVKLVWALSSSVSRALNMFLILVGTCLTGKSPSVTPRGLGRLDAGSGSLITPMNGCMAATRPSSMALTGPLLPLVGQSLAR